MIIAFHAGFPARFSRFSPSSHMRGHDREKPLKAASMPQLGDKYIFVRFSFGGSCSAAVVPLHGILFGIPLPF